MLCSSCSKTLPSTKQDLGIDIITIKIICYNVHCDNVYDPSDIIKKQHHDCDCIDKYGIELRRFIHKIKT